MTTKAGLTTLLLGCYTIAFGLAGLNAVSSTGLQWLYGVITVVGFVVTSWPVMLPWDAKVSRDAPGEPITRSAE